MPAWFKDATWSFIREMSGEITRVSPSMSSAGIWKQRDLPEPVGMTPNTSLPSRIASISRSWPSRKWS